METNINNNDEIEIDLGLLFRAIWAKIWLVIIAGAICGILAYMVSNFVMDKVYVSKAQLYVINRQNEGSMTYTDLQASTQIVKDYKVLIISRPVVEQVISNLALDMSVEDFIENVTVEIASDSRVLSVSVTNNDPYLAKQIVDNLADVSAIRICNVMQIDDVNIIEYGNVPEKPSEPNVKMITLLGAFAGIFMVCAIVVVKALLDDSIKTSEDVERYLGLSTLALIPITEEEYDGAPRNPKKKKKKVVRGKQR